MPADYASLIDAETWSFIRETDRYYPPDAVTLDMAGQRRVYDAMCRAFYRGRPEGLSVEDRAMGGVPCRVYSPASPRATVVYFHGGGFVVGGLDSHDDVCAEIADGCGVRVVSVDYRLAPEHRHPAHFDDAFAATLAVAAAFPGTLILAGDSAGGNLAAAVAHAARAKGPAIAGQVLIYPGLGGDQSRGSYVTHAEAPMLTKADIDFYAHVRFPEGYDSDGDVTAKPLQDKDFTDLPPTVAIGAECDPLCDDAADYAARIREARGAAVAWVEPGLVHGYLRARVTVTRARLSFTRIKGAISALAEGRLPEAPHL
ncbi:MAG TPA: alpha/beta hydrolase [Albidovulum sp.]|uniref:alpha/beta hydrolase fold domain-containing protein n=1 Tax=Albidovulum sp. TaxID=1872424 RepID=UPI002C6B5521|nr:alpha/beta hydrolase [Albidovulum sp.]